MESKLFEDIHALDSVVSKESTPSVSRFNALVIVADSIAKGVQESLASPTMEGYERASALQNAIIDVVYSENVSLSVKQIRVLRKLWNIISATPYHYAPLL